MRPALPLLALLLALPLSAPAQSVPTRQGCLGCQTDRTVVGQLTGDESHLYQVDFEAGDKIQIAVLIQGDTGTIVNESGPRFDLLEPGTDRLMFDGRADGPFAELTATVTGDYGVRVYLIGPEHDSGVPITYHLIAD